MKKLFRFNTLIILLLVLSLSLNATVSADDGNQIITGPFTGANKVDRNSTEALKSLSNARLRAQTRASQNYPMRWDYISNKYLTITLQTQEANNWCGPACMKMVQSGLGYSGMSQYQYAVKLGIASNGNGVYPWKIRQEWNKIHNPDIWEIDVNDGWIEFDLEWSLDANVALIASVDTIQLARYNYSTYHFIDLTGYDFRNASKKTVRYHDPINISPNSGSFTDTLGNITRALQGNGGIYLTAA